MRIVNFQMFKLDLEKAEEPEINCQHLLDQWKSKRVPEKHILLLYWLLQSLSLCGSQQTVEVLQEKGIPDHVTVPVHSHHLTSHSASLMPRQVGAPRASVCSCYLPSDSIQVTGLNSYPLHFPSSYLSSHHLPITQGSGLDTHPLRITDTLSGTGHHSQ